MLFSDVVRQGDNFSINDCDLHHSYSHLAQISSRKSPLTAKALLAGGFLRTSRWIRTRDGKLALQQALPKRPGVYAFVHGEIALYVGIAASGLAGRFSSYVSPGANHPTSLRMHAQLVGALDNAPFLDILTTAPPNSSWNGWPVNACAGLEVGLIEHYELPWNIRGAGKARTRRGNGLASRDAASLHGMEPSHG